MFSCTAFKSGVCLFDVHDFGQVVHFLMDENSQQITDESVTTHHHHDYHHQQQQQQLLQQPQDIMKSSRLTAFSIDNILGRSRDHLAPANQPITATTNGPTAGSSRSTRGSRSNKL